MAIHETVTPSGILITHEDGEPDPVTEKSKRRAYWIGAEKRSVPSFTQVCGQYKVEALPYAAEKLTAEELCALAEAGELPTYAPAALQRLESRGLRFWQQWKDRAKRGTVTHADFLQSATGETQVDLADVTAEERGYLRGVAAFQAEHEPEPVEMEFMVASEQFGFAGRPDFLGYLPNYRDGLAVVELKTRPAEKVQRYKDGTPKPLYLGEQLQLSGQSKGIIESGYPAPDYAVGLIVNDTGGYDLIPTPISHSTFLRSLASWQANRDLEAKARAMAKGTVPA